MISYNRPSWSLVFLCGSLCLGACQKKPAQSQDATGQDVARVGSDNVTTSELQFELRSVNGQAPTDQDKAQALQRIVARKSLAQKAIAAGVDRQPGILLEMRKAREQILANAAAMSDVKSQEQKISLEKINAFISANPLQFGGRRLLLVNELVVPSQNNVDKIVSAVKADTGLDQVETYLTDNKIPFQKKQVELDTANLPEVLSQALLKNENIPVIRTPPAGIFMQVKLTQPAPLTGAEAEKVAKSKLIRASFEREMSAPSPGDDVTYMPPYKELIEKMKVPQTTDK